MLKANIVIDVDTAKMLDEAKLNRGQQQFVHLVAEKSDEYVPWLSGDLKGSAKENKKSITYRPWHGGNESYAAIQYYTNRGMGRQGIARGGRRGPKWDERMWVDHKSEIVNEIASIIGGKPGK